MVTKIDQIHHDTFKRGSKTYFNSSIFFPAKLRRDIFILYGFLRTADDLVDSVPQKQNEFYSFRSTYHQALQGEHTDNVIIQSFVELLRRKDLDPGWVEAFLTSMELDLTKKVHRTLEETLHYTYGSAEVVGFIMAKIMNLSMDSYPYARLLGRSMQYINFIRDIEEDHQLGRVYLPLEESGLDNLACEYVSARPELFRQFIQVQIERYKTWQAEAKKGFSYIPWRYLIPVKTASDMYNWTACEIERNPFIVYQKKVKPSRAQILSRILLNTLYIRVKGVKHG